MGGLALSVTPWSVSPRLKTVLALVGSFVLGGGLLYLALRGVDFSSVGEALRTASYGWLLPLIAVTLLAHLLRAWRWQMLLGALPGTSSQDGPPISLKLAFYSVMIGYMVNYAAPRLGEVARSANVASQTSMRFPAVFGTVVVERVLDVLTLAVALLSVLALFGDRLAGVLGVFLANAGSALDGIPTIPWTVVLIGSVLVGVGVAFLTRLLFKRRLSQPADAEPGRLVSMFASFRDGLVSLLRVEQKGYVLLSTIGIWFCYLLMADIPLRMLGIADLFGINLLDSWALMNVGAIGMALPSPGGTGSYHYVTVQTLVYLFGVAETPAATYALFSHAAQLVLYAVVGFICLLLQGTSLKALRTTTTSAKQETASLPVQPG